MQLVFINIIVISPVYTRPLNRFRSQLSLSWLGVNVLNRFTSHLLNRFVNHIIEQHCQYLVVSLEVKQPVLVSTVTLLFGDQASSSLSSDSKSKSEWKFHTVNAVL